MLKLKENFNKEEIRIFAILAFIFGICTYFLFSFEPKLIYAVVLLVFFTLATSILFFLRLKIFYLFLILNFFFLGFFVITYDAFKKSKNYIIRQNLGVVWVEGRLDEIEIKNNQKRIIVSNLNFWQPDFGVFEQWETPKKIRINVRTDFEGDIKTGDIIKFKANLSSPIITAVYKDGYDFSRYAFFSEIGGVGYAISEIALKEKGRESFLNTLRNSLTQKLLKAFSSDFTNAQVSAVGVALIVGQEGYIENDTLNYFRKSGLGHILSISGLHMTIVMSGIFFITRKLLAYSQYLALNFNLAKVSSIFALIFGLFYLLICNYPVTAQRSYIMTALFFIALLLNRKVFSVLNVAIAGFFILLLEPKNIFSVSFLLSFLAVISLISFFSLPFVARNFNHFAKEHFLKKTFLVLGGNLISTIVAGSSTAFIGAYYFGGYSTYSMFANLVAVPITTFIIMPFGILTLIFANFNLEWLFGLITSFGLQMLYFIAKFFTQIPNSYVTTVKFEKVYLYAFVFSLIFLCCFKNKRIRVIFLIILGLVSVIILSPFGKIKQPDVIMAENLDLIVLKLDDEYYFSSLQKQRFFRKELSRMLNIQSPKKFICNDFCQFNMKQKTVVIINDVEFCKKSADILINLSNIKCNLPLTKNTTLYFDKFKEIKKGNVFIHLGNLKIENANKQNTTRYWNNY